MNHFHQSYVSDAQMDGNEMRLIVDIWEVLQDLGGIVPEKTIISTCWKYQSFAVCKQMILIT